MRFFSSDEIEGKLPPSIIHSFKESETRYQTLKEELEAAKANGETSVEQFLRIAKQANDAFLAWKGANKAVARFLNVNWPERTSHG